jgi:26S proteasome regulatory subunit N8
MAPTPAVSEVELHPLVLLSVVDHYYRVVSCCFALCERGAEGEGEREPLDRRRRRSPNPSPKPQNQSQAKDTNKRVVGVLLGEYGKDGSVDVTNSFAVPFEEQAAADGGAGAKSGADGKNAHDTIFFFDHSYLAAMYAMFKKVNARERVVGWYSTGRMRPSDLAIHDLVQPFCDEGLLSSSAANGNGPDAAPLAPRASSRPAVFVTCDVRPASVGLPFAAYAAVDEARADGTERASRAFASVPVRVGQTEAEAVGVEHLLRDVRDSTLSELSADVSAKVSALQGLSTRLQEVQLYLQAVLEGKLPVNHDVLALLQAAYGLLPNLGAAPLGRALATQSNDMMAAFYSASLVRSVLALHKLIDNKERRLWAERERAAREREKGAKKAAEKEKAAAASAERGGDGDGDEADK